MRILVIADTHFENKNEIETNENQYLNKKIEKDLKNLIFLFLSYKIGFKSSN